MRPPWMNEDVDNAKIPSDRAAAAKVCQIMALPPLLEPFPLSPAMS